MTCLNSYTSFVSRWYGHSFIVSSMYEVAPLAAVIAREGYALRVIQRIYRPKRRCTATTMSLAFARNGEFEFELDSSGASITD